jgi:hypothetical protein
MYGAPTAPITFTPSTTDQHEVPYPITVPTVVRGVSPESLLSPDDSANPQPPSGPATPSAVVPGNIQTCPIDPVVKLLAGKSDPETQQDALSALALMGATGTLQALRRANGNSTTTRSMHHLAGNLNDVLQPDDDDSAAAKQSRPPVFFTLGWNY